MYITENSPIHGTNNLQAWSTLLHSWLAIRSEPQKDTDGDISAMKTGMETGHTSTDVSECKSIQNIKTETTADKGLHHTMLTRKHKGWDYAGHSVMT